jgi:hypothetical protein
LLRLCLLRKQYFSRELEPPYFIARTIVSAVGWLWRYCLYILLAVQDNPTLDEESMWMADSKLASLLKNVALTEQSVEMLNALPEADSEAFLATLIAVVENKDARINGAVNNALTVVPLPLRGTVKKMLFH